MGSSPKPSSAQLIRLLQVEEKQRLEQIYCVRIHPKALILAACIAIEYTDILMPQSKAGVGYKSHKKCVRQQLAVDLLERACFELLNKIDTDDDIDLDEYLFARTHIELYEISKEKYPGKRVWSAYVKKEHKEVKEKWTKYETKWKPLINSWRRSEKRSKDVLMLEHVRLELVSYMKQLQMEKKMNHLVFQQLYRLVTQLGLAAQTEQQELLIVSPFMVAKVVRSLTGIPISWLLPGTEPKLFPRFTRRVVGQEFTKFAITTALLNRKRFVPGPCGSLLFLYHPGCGRTELAKAIAEQVFDDKDMLTEFDMSKYNNSYSHSIEPGRFREHLIQVVKKKPFGVVLLDNIEIACPDDEDTLLQILTHGRLSDDQGHNVDFSKTFIILTSNVEEDIYLMGKKIENFPKKELGNEDHLLRLNDCRRISILAEAKKHFRTELIEKLDDVIALEPLSFLHYKCITRHLLRDIACSFTPKRIILYPSEAAVGVIVFDNRYTYTKRPTKNIRSWLENNVTPVIEELLTTNQIDDMSVVYIDAMVGSEELSYRCEKNGASEYQDLTDFLTTFKELRIAYNKEKEWVKKIYMLRILFYELMSDEKAARDPTKVAEGIHILDSLLRNATDVNKTDDCKVITADSLDEEVNEHREIKKSKMMSMERINELYIRLCKLWKGEFIGIVAKLFRIAISSTQDVTDRPLKTYLILGLTEIGKASLVKRFTEQFKCDDGTNLFCHIDISKSSDMNASFLRKYNGDEQALEIMPYTIFFLDGIEEARGSNYKALISLLAHGMMIDEHGHKATLSNNIFILSSNGGYKCFIADILGQNFKEVQDDSIKKEESKSFRSELLNHVDEMVLFNPLIRNDHQLKTFLRLSMAFDGGLDAVMFKQSFKTLFMPNDTEELLRAPDTLETLVRKYLLKRQITERTARTAGHMKNKFKRSPRLQRELEQNNLERDYRVMKIYYKKFGLV